VITALEIARVFRSEYGRAVSILVRRCGDIQTAEEAVQDAFATALERWPSEGVPPSPTGWIITTARNRAIDRLRREASRLERSTEAVLELAASGAETEPQTPGLSDDRLRLIFTCCHPALALPARVALTLRLLGGLETHEIARAFLVPEPTLAQRLVRAKAKIREAGIPYRVPELSQLGERLRGVLAVVYLIFNEGYAATSGDRLVRVDLCEEAIRLGRLLVQLFPQEPEVLGLLALMLLAASRLDARVGAEGQLLPLPEQDRSRWSRPLIQEGQQLVHQCLERGGAGPYQLQAAIQAMHSDAQRASATDWPQIVRLYDLLLEIDPRPVVALNRAVAIAEVQGPAAALALLDPLQMPGYYLLPAVRAGLLRRLGRTSEAANAYAEALALVENATERAFLEKRHREVGGAPQPRPALSS
jgi:RNA polymerase sigma-70 factor (ECF subfamily)